MRGYSGGDAASVSLRNFFCLRQKLLPDSSRPPCGGKILAFEPEEFLAASFSP